MSDETGTPRSILFATDLSARCDRALDRAVQLAAEWNARLVVVHAIEEGGPAAEMLDAPGAPATDPASLARRRLIRDVGEVATTATLVLERGRPADAILRTAAREGCDLIVLGIARDELFGRYALGTTVDRLIRSARVPLLIVKERPRRPYHHIVVASDLSEPSRHALAAALRLFPAQRLTVFHAFDPPMENLADDPSTYVRDARMTALGETLQFLAETPRAPATPEPEAFVEYGRADDVLRAHVLAEGTDLVVLGSHGRSAIYEIFLGSVAKRILDGVPCDCLLVREPQAASDDHDPE